MGRFGDDWFPEIMKLSRPRDGGYGDWFRQPTAHCTEMDTHQLGHRSSGDRSRLEVGTVDPVWLSVFRPGPVAPAEDTAVRRPVFARANSACAPNWGLRQ